MTRGGAPTRMLLLVYQLPEHPSRYRVNVWRRLRRVGAVAIHRALYLLEDTPLNRLRALDLAHDIENWGGEARMFVGAPLEAPKARQLDAQRATMKKRDTGR